MIVRPFVVGVSRSGTTLLRLMLDAHSELCIPPETHFLPALIASRPGSAEEFVARIAAQQTWPDFHLNMNGLLQRIKAETPFSLRGAVIAFYAAYAESQGKPRWGDKTPPYVLQMDSIAGLLPEARFIHIIRDVRDVALSLRDKWFGPGADVSQAAIFWRDRILAARSQAAQLPAGSYLELRFEDLVAAPEHELRKVAQFIEIPYQDAMLEYHRHAERRLDELGDWRDPEGGITLERSRRLDIHRHTLHSPDTAQIGKWRAHYTTDEAARFCEIAGPLMRQLGYEP